MPQPSALPVDTLQQTLAANTLAVRTSLNELSRLCAQSATELSQDTARAGTLCANALREGHKILACGNGGSAADAQHFVAELVGRMGIERDPLAAITLSVDPSIVTCIANDYGYNMLFSRQVEALGKPGDVLLALTTSGQSPNVLAAVESAHKIGMSIVVLMGNRPNPKLNIGDVLLSVPSMDTGRIQEIHTALLHSICAVVEQTLFPDHKSILR